MRKIWLILPLFFIFFCTSCVDVDDVVVEDVVSVKSRGMGLKNMLLDVTLQISNESSTKFSLKDINIEVVDGDKVVIVASVDDKITIPKGESMVVLPMKINLNLGLTQLFSISRRIDSLKFNISTKASGFLYSKNIEINNLSSKQFGQFIDLDLKNLFVK